MIFPCKDSWVGGTIFFCLTQSAERLVRQQQATTLLPSPNFRSVGHRVNVPVVPYHYKGQAPDKINKNSASLGLFLLSSLFPEDKQVIHFRVFFPALTWMFDSMLLPYAYAPQHAQLSPL